MSPATTADKINVDLDESILMGLIALALEKLQRRRHRPKKNGRLHRV